MPEGTEPVAQEKPAEAATPQPTAPTAKEQLKALQAQLEEVAKAKANSEESYKSLQRKLNQTNEELRKQADLRLELDGFKETQKILVSMLAERGVTEDNPDNMAQAKKQDYLNQYNEIVKQQEVRKKEAELKTKQTEYVKQADEIWEKAKTLGLPDDDENLLDIEDYLKAGNLKRAEVKLKKLEVSKKPAETPKETEEERITRLAEEKYQERLKKDGLLKTDSVSPSGRSVSAQEANRRFAEGEINEGEWLKLTGRRQ